MGVDGISSGIVQQAMQMKNLEISSEIKHRSHETDNGADG